MITITHETGGAAAVACSALLGIFIACLPTFVKKSQARLRSRLLSGRQQKYATLHCHGATHLQTVSPTLLVKAILLLMGRPWEGSAGWPNRFLVPKATCNNPVPNTNAPASKMHT